MGTAIHCGRRKELLKVKKLRIQSVSGFLQVMWALPFIGIVFIFHPALPIMMIVLHSVVVVYFFKNKLKMTGNIVGIFTSILSLTIALKYDYIEANIGDIFPRLILSWPLHIVSAIMTVGNHRVNFEMLEEKMRRQGTENGD